MFKPQKKILWIFLIFIFFCNNGKTQQEKPQKVPRIVYEIYPNEWYKEQSQLWAKEIEKNPKNAEAWHNYYNANRYAHFEDFGSTDKQTTLRKIIEDMEKAIPGTYEYYYLKYKNDCKLSDISLVEKAHQLKPDEPEPLYDLIAYNIVNGNEDKLKELYTKLYESHDIAPWLLNYNYNVLMSTEQNAIIFTNGDNDTYPAEMLQFAKGIREDITIINISLSAVQSYLKYKMGKIGIKFDLSTFKSKYFGTEAEDPSYKFLSHKFIQDVCKIVTKNKPGVPIYFALTMYKQHIQPIFDDLYIVGLAYRYSPTRLDNFAIVKKNLEKNFRLDYLKYDWYSEKILGERLSAQLNMNYYPIMVMLAEHYKTSGEEEKAQAWKNFALKIAQKAGMQEAIDELEKKGI